MLNIYPITLELCRTLQRECIYIARRDADLARQLRRALTSVPLNVAEGAYSRGRNRQARYHTALGSAREVLACLEVAHAMGHLDRIDPAVADRIDHIVATLYRLATKP